MLCPRCTREIQNESRFCPHCGERTETAPQPVFASAPSSLSASESDLWKLSISNVMEALSPRLGLAHVQGYDERQPYEVAGLAGRGRMSHVFHIRLPGGGRDLAIKRFHCSDLNLLDAGFQEYLKYVERITQFDHTHIVHTYYVGRDMLGPFVVMEHVDGKSLSRLMEQKSHLTVTETLDIARGIALGLFYAHRRGVFHLSLKPSNILLNREGLPRITDFSIFQVYKKSDAFLREQSKEAMAFLAPEVLNGPTSIDQRADIFSFGMLLYHMLTGMVPRVIRESAIPENFQSLIFRAIEEKVEHRYYSMVDVLNDLDHLMTRMHSAMASLRWVSCTKCGHKSLEDAKFCGGCGIAFTAVFPTSPGAVTSLAPPTPSSPTRMTPYGATFPQMMAPYPQAMLPPGGMPGMGYANPQMLFPPTLPGMPGQGVPPGYPQAYPAGPYPGQMGPPGMPSAPMPSAPAPAAPAPPTVVPPATTPAPAAQQAPQAAAAPGPQGAAPAIAKLSPEDSANREAVLRKTREFMAAGSFAEAQECCQAYLDGHAGDVDLTKLLDRARGKDTAAKAAEQEKMKDWAKALASYQEALKLLPDEKTALEEKIQYCRKKKLFSTLTGSPVKGDTATIKAPPPGGTAAGEQPPQPAGTTSRPTAMFKFAPPPSPATAPAAKIGGSLGSLPTAPLAAPPPRAPGAVVAAVAHPPVPPAGEAAPAPAPGARASILRQPPSPPAAAGAGAAATPEINPALSGRITGSLNTVHTATLLAVTLSPRGDVVATAAMDKTVKLWTIHPFQNIRTLHGHEGNIYDLCFSPDGKTLASCSHDATIRLWSVDTGAAVATLQGHEGRVTSISFAPDGKLLASCGDDSSVRFWNCPEGSEAALLAEHTAEVNAVAFNTEGTLVASRGQDKKIILWDVEKFQAIAGMAKHKDAISGMKFSPIANRLASCSWDSQIIVWKVPTGEVDKTLKGHKGALLCLAMSEDGKYLASGGWDKSVKLWEMSTGNSCGTFTGHTNGIGALAFSKDGKLLASASYDKSVRVWSIPSGNLVGTISGHAKIVNFIQFTPNSKGLISGSLDNCLGVWQVVG
ncbi:MAG: protein kinase [Planctomycetes bacterium]|nr:protein kinase [Planctomycetota bacterium]